MVQYEKDFGDGSNALETRRAIGTLATATATANTFHDEEPERERGFMGKLHRLFGAREEAIIGLLTLFFATAVTAIVVKDAYFARDKDKSGVQRIIATKWNDRTLVFPIEGLDAAGRRALFDVVVLTKNYGWVLGSASELERDGTKLNARDIEDEVLAPQLRQGLGNAIELIAVGVASQEGELQREIQRGGLRAARIAQWVRGAMGERVPMWTLNLGRYLEPCTECEDAETSWQRPFIVIAVRDTDNGVNLTEALRNAMSDKENLPSPDRYSTFALTKFVK
jgi:hypothetical protein